MSSLVPAILGRINYTQALFAGIVGIAAMSVTQEDFWFSLIVVAVMLIITFQNQYAPKYLPLVLLIGFFALWKFFLESIHSKQQADVAGI